MKNIIIGAFLVSSFTSGIRVNIKRQDNQEEETEKEFAKFSSKFQRHHRNKDEYEKRLKIFGKNKEKIETFNERESKVKGFRRTLNQFSDMTEEEKKQYEGLDLNLSYEYL